MRLYSIHPKYLDQRGLCGLWAESFLAKSVLLKGEYTLCPHCNGSKEYKYFCDLIQNKKWVTCPKCKGLGKIKTPYYQHPQLLRFKNSSTPLYYISYYLTIIYEEAKKRGYNFDNKKIQKQDCIEEIHFNTLSVTNKQLIYEFHHLQNKLYIRDKKKHIENLRLTKNNNEKIETHPLFTVVNGEIEEWEKIK